METLQVEPSADIHIYHQTQMKAYIVLKWEKCFENCLDFQTLYKYNNIWFSLYARYFVNCRLKINLLFQITVLV